MNNFLNGTKKTITYGRFMHPKKFHYFTTKICLKLKVFFQFQNCLVFDSHVRFDIQHTCTIHNKKRKFGQQY